MTMYVIHVCMYVCMCMYVCTIKIIMYELDVEYMYVLEHVCWVHRDWSALDFYYRVGIMYYNFKGLKSRVHGTCVLCVFFYSWYSFVVLANTTCGRRGKKFKFEHSFGKLANAPVLCPGAEQQSLYTLYRHQAFGALPVNS